MRERVFEEGDRVFVPGDIGGVQKRGVGLWGTVAMTDGYDCWVDFHDGSEQMVVDSGNLETVDDEGNSF